MKVRIEVEGLNLNTQGTVPANTQADKQYTRKQQGFPELAKTDKQTFPVVDDRPEGALRDSSVNATTDESYRVLDVEPKSTIKQILAQAKIETKGRYITLNNDFVDLDTVVKDENSYIKLCLRK